jgi:hypothetical protein
MWDYFRPKDGIWYRWDLNGASAWLMKKGDAWRTAFKTISPEDMGDDFGGPQEAPPPEGLTVYETIRTGVKAALLPTLGEKPCLVTMPNPIRLFPKTQVRFGVFLPPLLRFELFQNGGLSQAMPFAFSESWFGNDTVSGRLCLSLPSGLVSRHEREVPHIPSLVLGGLEVCNCSKNPVDLDRLAIHTESLNVYERGNRFFSDTTAVDFLAGGDIKLRVVPFEGGKRITDKPGDVFVRRGTDFIKEIAKNGLG